jgi:hypothetical protein
MLAVLAFRNSLTKGMLLVGFGRDNTHSWRSDGNRESFARHGLSNVVQMLLDEHPDAPLLEHAVAALVNFTCSRTGALGSVVPRCSATDTAALRPVDRFARQLLGAGVLPPLLRRLSGSNLGVQTMSARLLQNLSRAGM